MSEQQTQEKSYFESRIIDELGITPKLNKIKLIGINPAFDTEETKVMPIFFPDKEDNICIRVWNLRREIPYFLDKKNDNPHSTSNREKQFVIKRLKTPREYTVNGKTKYAKYDFPKGAGTYPFLTPGIVEKYEKKENIDTLVLTEGFIKSFKGYMHGLDIVGLSSITHVKDKETETMYRDVLDVIVTCKVKTVIMLYDGDCRDISLSALTDGDDLYTRPASFLSSISKVSELLKDYKVSIYFASILSEQINNKPKGLDDLLCEFKGSENLIVDDLVSISKPSRYFYRIETTATTNRVYKWFNVSSEKDFYNYHAERIGEKPFLYKGTQYYWSADKQELILTIPRNVKDFFRVGDNYYQFVKVPNKYKSDETKIVARTKDTVTMRIGKKYIDLVPYYEEFCNVPDHVNYTQVINNCFNLYNKFEYEPAEGDCDSILDFLRHIFGSQFEFGLDYIQLLYQQPCQLLPVLCLVSKENKTGKSTLIYLMKIIFASNCAVVSNDDLSNQFNFSWVGKLLICCEESFLDKRQTVEKIKALSTNQSKILVNRKGKDHSEIDFFGKFILASNNEDNFIIASQYDERYWVIKVPQIKKQNPKLLEQMAQEIPAFLQFLNNRKLSTNNEDRMWFRPELLKTDALQNLKDNNRPTVITELTFFLKETFQQFGYREILLSPDAIRKELFAGKFSIRYISQVIRDNLKYDMFINDTGEIIPHRFYWPQFNATDEAFKDLDIDKSRKYVGRPFCFKIEDFLFEDEITHVNNLRQFRNDFSNKPIF